VKNMQKLVPQVEKIARAAGDLLLEYWHKPLQIEQKLQAGIVTNADKASEEFIVTELQKLDSTIGFWAEERGNLSNNSQWCWVIDPLDGTTNFAYKISYFCISIALTCEGVPQLGVIYNPLTKELFVAQKEAGALCNGKKITVAQRALADSVVAASFPYIDEHNYGWCDPVIVNIWPHVTEVRYMGSAALDLAYAASGVFDAAFFRRVGWWDIAAGMLLVQEAGGIATDYAGVTLMPDYRSIIAGASSFVSWFYQNAVQ